GSRRRCAAARLSSRTHACSTHSGFWANVVVFFANTRLSTRATVRRSPNLLSKLLTFLTYKMTYSLVSTPFPLVRALATMIRGRCRTFRVATARRVLFGWTFDPKVAGSRPANSGYQPRLGVRRHFRST